MLNIFQLCLELTKDLGIQPERPAVSLNETKPQISKVSQVVKEGGGLRTLNSFSEF
jgi:hypothetical protein